MTTTTRAAFAAFLFADFVAGTLAPRPASAHVMDVPESPILMVSQLPAGTDIPSVHRVQAPPNLRVSSARGLSHTAAVISWDVAHSHQTIPVVLSDSVWIPYDGRRSWPAPQLPRTGTIPRGSVVSVPNPTTRNTGYWVTLRTTPLPMSAGTIDRCIDRSVTAPPGCIRYPRPRQPLRGRRITVHDLAPATTYYVHVAGTFAASGKIYASAGTTTTFTTAASPDGTEPETPETPEEPETPDPRARSLKID